MSQHIRRRVTVAQVDHEQYGLERRGHDGGELTEPAGGEHSRATDDYSTTGLFRDENFARDSCGDGEARSADRSWEGDEGRPPEIYRDTAESDFTVRNAAGLEEESPEPIEEEGGSTVGEGVLSTPPKRTANPIHRRIVRR